VDGRTFVIGTENSKIAEGVDLATKSRQKIGLE
jgi:hypothetical protein